MDDMIAETAAASWLPLQDGDQLTQSGTRVDRAFLDLFDGAFEHVAGADFHVLGTCGDKFRRPSSVQTRCHFNHFPCPENVGQSSMTAER
jgi:hypothetical protein